MKVIEKNVQHGVLLSILVLLDKAADKAAYRKFPDVAKCPHCGKPAEPEDKNCKILIPTPLNEFIPGVSIDVGTVVTVCSKCGKEITSEDQIDLSAFPEVTTLLARLRQAARQQLVKGGAKSGKK